MSKAVKPARITSFAKCAVELVPARRSRTVVTLSGVLFLLLGLAIVVHLQAPPVVKILLAFAWTGDVLLGFRRQVRGQARVQRLQLDSQGHMASHCAAGKTEATQLLAGSIVLSHWACLRLGFDDGSHYVELILRTDCSPTDWRRLHLIWRQAL